MKKEVQGRWGRVATRCAAIAERDAYDMMYVYMYIIIYSERTNTHVQRPDLKNVYML